MTNDPLTVKVLEEDILEAFRENTPDRIIDIFHAALSNQRTRICEELSSMKKDSGSYDDGLNRVEAVIEAKKEGFNSALDDAINRIKGL